MLYIILFSILFLIIYLLSVWGAYKFIQNAHYHPHGRYQMFPPTMLDKYMIFIPLLNMMGALDFLMGEWKEDKYKEDKLDKPTNFFRAKFYNNEK